ncbi:MAG TPA: DUF72 domain-containing protein [Pyrinomonadaceae bacterium]|nr:DUF72 domain-containing protein [Pyrinomonadaceae bacterium]
MAVFVGTSGWSYAHWEGVLYAHGTPPRERLGVYVRHFGTVEVNSTFYRWPGARAFRSWFERTPEGFLFGVKAPRGLTHGSKLYRPEKWVERIARDLAGLRHKRGVLLVQLPPGMAYDYARLGYFLACLPAGLRVAVEFRHPSWHREDVFDLLESRGAAYCVMSGAGLPCVLRATAGFVYARLHGPDRAHLYGGSYTDDDLRWWAARVREWEAQGRDVLVYFNNDGGGNAVRDAARLKWLLAL